MSEQPIHTTDVAIIGAGPVGLFAVFECGMLKMKTHVVDALDMAGGQCAALYPEKPIYDIPGYPKVGALELIENLQAQAAPFNPVYHLGQRVEKLVRGEDGWLDLETAKGTKIRAKAVILAAGVGAFGPNKPPLARIDDFENKGVHYFVQRREDFRGKRVAIAGGGDSALDWTLSLADVAARVMVIHRRDKFRGAPDTVAKVMDLAKAGKIDLVTPYQLEGLEGEPGALTHVVLKDLDGNLRKLEADALLAFFGLAMNLGPIAGWGLALHKGNIAVEAATLATSVPGIFAIGDIADYPDKLKLILQGFADAAMAAHAAHKPVHLGEVLHFECST
ncbi:MAG: NAD(P)/FAD-dependent oxidoreductase, partial [Rhodospirillales bacterium]